MAAPNKIVGIYKVTSPTGRVYIGQSINILARFKRYRDLNCKSQRKLYRSLIKYGWRAHSFQIVHELPKDIEISILNVFEQTYIDAYKSARFKMLNIKEGGANGNLSRETKIRQSLSLKGKVRKAVPMTDIKDEFLSGISVTELMAKYSIGRVALSNRLKKVIDPELVSSINQERKIISLGKVAKKFTEGFTPWNKGASVGKGEDNNFFGKRHSEESKAKMKAKREKVLICFNNGITYTSPWSAAEKLGLHQSSVAKVARGYQKQHKGYIFKYL